MDYLKFLAEFKQVQTAIGLVSFLIAAVLGYFYSVRNGEAKSLSEIISKVKTETQANLVRDLENVIPKEKLQVLTKRDSRDILQLELTQKADRFKQIMRAITIGMILLFVLILAIIGQSYSDFKKQELAKIPSPPPVKITTSGDNSPVINGNNNTVTHKEK